MTSAQPLHRAPPAPAEHGAEAIEAIAFLRALIAAQADGEGAVQALITQKLTDAGAVVETMPFDPATVPVVGEFAMARAQQAGERVNVIGRLPGDAARQSLLMFAHPDSEPVAGTDTWTHDPFAGEIADEALCMAGAMSDDSGEHRARGTLAIARAAPRGPVPGRRGS